WTPAQVSAALTGSAHRLPGYGVDQQGAGRLDVAAADTTTVFATPHAAAFGLADLGGSTLSARTAVTLTNTGSRSTPVTLAAHRGADEDTKVTVTPRSATLAPGEAVRVTVSLHGPRPDSSRDVDGWVTASVGGRTLTVPYQLSVRTLEVHATPDPTTGSSTAYVYAEPAVAAAPKVTVSPPSGRSATVTTVFDHGGWWRVTVPATAGPGVYRLTATATAADGRRLRGDATFEKIPAADGGRTWQAVGPEAEGGEIATSPASPLRMYAMPNSTRHGGLFRTDDAGRTWHELRTLPVGEASSDALAVDPTDGDTVYYAVAPGEQTFNGKLLASHDAGRTWTSLPVPDVQYRDISVGPTGRVLAVSALDGNAYLSTDRGAHWQTVSVPGESVQHTLLAGSDLYLATDTSVYVERGIAAGPGTLRKLYTVTGDYAAVNQLAGAGGVILVGTSDPLATGEIVESHDGGRTWDSHHALPKFDVAASLTVLGGDAYASTAAGLQVDRGVTGDWTSMPGPAEPTIFRVARFPGIPSRLVVSANRLGIYTTDDGGDTYRRIGLTATPVNSLALSRTPSGEDELIAGTDFGSYHAPLPEQPTVDAAHRDWGTNGEEGAFGSRVTSVATDPHHPNVAYRFAAYSFNLAGIEKSTDGGATWDISEDIRASVQPYQVAVSPADPNRVYATVLDGQGFGLLVSRDAGATWRKVGVSADVPVLVPDRGDPDRVWLGGPDGLYRTDDAGTTLTKLQDVPVTALGVDPADAAHLVVGGDGIWTSTDGGRTLRRASVAPLRMKVTAVLFGAKGHVYAATGATEAGLLPVGGRGVLASRDGGARWTNISAGLENLDTSGLVLAPDGKWLYAGTVGGGVYRLRL
ncbi:MAG TPA: hypothetical protein VF053_07005, partial [Streptosporangiales bacterium]